MSAKRKCSRVCKVLARVEAEAHEFDPFIGVSMLLERGSAVMVDESEGEVCSIVSALDRRSSSEVSERDMEEGIGDAILN
jgi:hypothetical protein